jgi:hypothetical protein
MARLAMDGKVIFIYTYYVSPVHIYLISKQQYKI